MSKISLSGDPSGTGTFTIASPNSSSNYTLTLPTSSGTMVVTGGAQTIEFGAGSASTPSITFTGDTNTGIFSPTADTVGVATGGSERMRITSTGSVGIGITPSSWDTLIPLELNAGSLSSYSTTQLYLSQNAYYASAWKYKTTAAATQYYQTAGQHIWYGAPSGTAGNAITFTQILQVEKAKSLALEGATSQTGTGITFPATQSASTDANTLDDYEEGTWTATFAASGATFTNLARDTRYTKIGNLVTISGYLQVYCSAGSGANAVTISGLPFASFNSSYYYSAGFTMSNIVANAGGFSISLGLAPNTTTIDLYRTYSDAGTTKQTTIKSQDITDSNFSFRFSFSYTTAS